MTDQTPNDHLRASGFLQVVAAGVLALSAAPALADSSVDALLDRLGRSCGAPGFSLEQRVASFSGWVPVADAALPDIIDDLAYAFIERSVLLGQFSADEAAGFGPRMVERLTERANAAPDDNRALHILSSGTDPSVSVAVEVTQSARVDMTTCRLHLSAPTTETLTELIGLFRLSHEMAGPGIRTWTLGASYPAGDSPVNLGRELSILSADDGSAAAAILTFTTQAMSF